MVEARGGAGVQDARTDRPRPPQRGSAGPPAGTLSSGRVFWAGGAGEPERESSALEEAALRVRETGARSPGSLVPSRPSGHSD